MTTFPRRPGAFVLLLVLTACGATRESTDARADRDRTSPSVAERPRASRARLDPALLHEAPAALAGRLREQVEWLAHDERAGRRAGTHEGRVAARWISEQLAAIGVEPAGDPSSAGGWFQEFQVPLEARAGESSAVEWSDGAATRRFAAVPLYCAASGTARAPLVWCGFGIDDEERGWNDFSGAPSTIDPAGWIAVVVRGVPDVAPPRTPEAPANPHAAAGAAPSDPWGNAASVFTKVMNAKRRGASAVILVPKTEAEGVLAFDSGHGARAGIPAVTLDFASSRALIEALLGVREVDATRPAEALARSKHAVLCRADVLREHGTALNVLGRVRGKDSSRCVVVGAHYDHLGHGGTGSLAPNERDAIHNGADDNASGTAAVIEIARALKADPPACDVIVALWSGEELGLLGSEHWTKQPLATLKKVRANLNLDMVGRAGNGKLQVLGAGTAKEFEAWMKDAGAASGLELVVSTSGGAMGGSSDHQSFLKNGIPALHLFSGLHADYHKPSDDADKFEAEGTAKVVALGVDLVRRMASAEELEFVAPAAPKEGDRAGQRAQTSGFRVRLGSIPNYAYDGKGVLIDGASAGTPAERAGLIKGDVLTQIGDVALESVHDLTYALGRFKPGDVVVVKYTRDGEEQETRVTLAAPAGDVR